MELCNMVFEFGTSDIGTSDIGTSGIGISGIGTSGIGASDIGTSDSGIGFGYYSKHLIIASEILGTSGYNFSNKVVSK